MTGVQTCALPIWIGLSSNLDTLVVGEVDMLYKRVYVEWVEV